MFFRYDVYHSGHGVGSVECRLCSLHDFDALDVVRVNQSEVVLASVVTVYSLSVDENQNVVVSQSVELCLASHVALVEREGRCESAQYLLDGLCSVAFYHLPGNHFGLHGHVFQQMTRTCGCDHHLL